MRIAASPFFCVYFGVCMCVCEWGRGGEWKSLAVTNAVFVDPKLFLVDPRQATIGEVLSFISSVGSHDSLYFIVWLFLLKAHLQVSRQF